MKKITLYTTPTCPFCIHALRLLDHKNLNYQNIDVSKDRNLRKEMTKKAGGRTSVPQIWIGDFHVGGCDELYQLEHTGKLDTLLQN